MSKPMAKNVQKKILRLLSARADIDYSCSAFKMFEGSDNPTIRYHALLAMVVSYCRPFTENFGLGNLKCEFPDYADIPLEDAQIRHQRMMDLRNKFLSHSSIEGAKVILLAPGAIDRRAQKVGRDYSWNIAKRGFIRREISVWLFELVDALRVKLDEEIGKTLRKVDPRQFDASGRLWLETPADDFKWTKNN